MPITIRLWDEVGFGLILAMPTGVIYSNQAGGSTCLQPELEGAYIPLRNDCTEVGSVLQSPSIELFEYFMGHPNHGSIATTGISEVDADFIDGILRTWGLAPAMQVDRTKLPKSFESWVHVVVTGQEIDDPSSIYSGIDHYPVAGVITWPNSD